MGVGANRLNITMPRNRTIGSAYKFITQAFQHGLNTPVLPEIRVPATGAKICNTQLLNIAHSLNFLP